MFKVTGSGPIKAKLTPDYSLPSTSDAAGSAPEFTGAWSLSREAQVRSEVRLLYPMDAPTPPVTTPSSGDLAENGSASTTTTVGATGDAKIDGILRGVKWSGGITYSDTDAASDYQSGYFSDSDGDGTSAQNEGFSQFTPQQLLAMHSALNAATYTQLAGAYGFSIEGFTNLTIDYSGAGSSAATIRGANSSDAPTAYAYYPADNIYGGDTFFGNAYDGTSNSLKNPIAGNYAWHTMLHELGHSLGLKHGQELGGVSNTALPTAWDSIEFSVMTYRSYVGAPLSGYSYEQFGAPQTYMMLDIAALQTMYGADYTVHSENTTYSWNPTTGITYINGDIAIQPGANRIFATIWDGGGIDTYDLSAYSNNVTIDLTPGGNSLFSSTQQAYLGGGNYARGNIFNALTFGGSNASLIENATGGSGNDTITGNAVANLLKGGIGSDVIYGGDGNDIIQGGFGEDSVYGEAGNDVFQVLQGEFGDNIDGGSGTDRLDLSDYTTTYGATVDLGAGSWDFDPSFGGPYTITSVEDVDGTQLADSITGSSGSNVLRGNGGNDTLKGGSGSDTIYGGDGNDIIQGGFSTDNVYGEAGDDVFQVLQGEFGDNIDGGSGTDRLDLSDYTVDYGATVDLSAGSWDFNPSFGGPYTITGVEDVDGTQLADTITGNGANNVLRGNGGNDTINGDSGNDTMIGGTGNDIFDGGSGVDTAYGEAGDDVYKVIAGWNGGYGELFSGGAGTDTIDGSTLVSDYVVNLTDGEFAISGGSGLIALASVENATTGSGNDTLTGSAEANRLIGNAGNDSLNGLDGNDVLQGGAGDDRLSGGNGNDTIDGGADNDTVTYAGITTGVTVSLAIAGAQNTVGAGIDTLIGIENLSGTSYNDTLTGNSGVNQLFGRAGNDILNGGTGADYMNGDTGDDTYYVDNVGDNVVEASASGGTNDQIFSSVTYNLAGRYIERLTLTGSANITGTGNDLAQTIVGNSGDNDLIGMGGNDILQGGAGADRLNGGTGNDTLDGGTGSDTVTYAGITAGVNVSLAIAGAQNTGAGGTDTLIGIENLSGTSYNDTLRGDSGANELYGRAGNDTLIGGSGADLLVGDTGNDIYYVDNVGDVVVETAGNGTSDLVYAAINYSLVGLDIEQLTLTGSSNINGTGNSQAQTITGNSGQNILDGAAGNDVLNGAGGADTLTGGTGSDIFLFASALGGGNIDSITDYSVADDTIQLDDAIFTGLALGTLVSGQFYVGSAAHDATDRIIYNKTTGALLFDADGTGSIAAVQFATLTPNLTMATAEFVVV